jgi:hypothetical protein
MMRVSFEVFRPSRLLDVRLNPQPVATPTHTRHEVIPA